MNLIDKLTYKKQGGIPKHIKIILTNTNLSITRWNKTKKDPFINRHS